MPDYHLDRSRINVVTMHLEDGDTHVRAEPPRHCAETSGGPFVMPWTVSINRGLLVITASSRGPLEALHAAIGEALAVHPGNEPAEGAAEGAYGG